MTSKPTNKSHPGINRRSEHNNVITKKHGVHRKFYLKVFSLSKVSSSSNIFPPLPSALVLPAPCYLPQPSPVSLFLGKSLLAFPSHLAEKNLPISSYGRPILAATPSSFSGSEEEREKRKAKEKGIK